MKNERRTQADRRCRDVALPGGRSERRLRFERRVPEAFESELSASDFERYVGRAAKTGQANVLVTDGAADMAGRRSPRS